MAFSIHRLITYSDMIDHLAMWASGSALEAEQRVIRAAVQNAYQELWQAKDWNYFNRHERINCDAPYETGTISTSGTTVTLDSGTWPLWARFGRLLIDGDDNIYKIASRTSDTEVELEYSFYPPSNVAVGTGYTLYRAVYPMPPGVRITDMLAESDLTARYVSPSNWMRLERHYNSTNDPWYFTIMGGEDYYACSLYLHGYPTTTTTFDFIYTRMARRLKYDGQEKYSSQDGSTLLTCAGTSATFGDGLSMQTDVIGAVLRIGAAGATERPRGMGDTNMYDAQQVILRRDNVDEVTLIDNIALSKTSDQYSISDPIDMPGYMHGALRRRAEWELSTMLANHDRQKIAYAQYEYALKECMARDGPPDETGGLFTHYWPLDREVWQTDVTTATS